MWRVDLGTICVNADNEDWDWENKRARLETELRNRSKKTLVLRRKSKK